MPSTAYGCPYCGLSDEDMHSIHTHIVEMHYPEFLAAIAATEVGRANLARNQDALNEGTKDQPLTDEPNACPKCGERRTDRLTWQVDERVRCGTCGTVYEPHGGTAGEVR